MRSTNSRLILFTSLLCLLAGPIQAALRGASESCEKDELNKAGIPSEFRQIGRLGMAGTRGQAAPKVKVAGIYTEDVMLDKSKHPWDSLLSLEVPYKGIDGKDRTRNCSATRIGVCIAVTAATCLENPDTTRETEKLLNPKFHEKLAAAIEKNGMSELQDLLLNEIEWSSKEADDGKRNKEKLVKLTSFGAEIKAIDAAFQAGKRGDDLRSIIKQSFSEHRNQYESRLNEDLKNAKMKSFYSGEDVQLARIKDRDEDGKDIEKPRFYTSRGHTAVKGGDVNEGLAIVFLDRKVKGGYMGVSPDHLDTAAGREYLRTSGEKLSLAGFRDDLDGAAAGSVDSAKVISVDDRGSMHLAGNAYKGTEGGLVSVPYEDPITGKKTDVAIGIAYRASLARDEAKKLSNPDYTACMTNPSAAGCDDIKPTRVAPIGAVKNALVSRTDDVFMYQCRLYPDHSSCQSFYKEKGIDSKTLNTSEKLMAELRKREAARGGPEAVKKLLDGLWIARQKLAAPGSTDWMAELQRIDRSLAAKDCK